MMIATRFGTIRRAGLTVLSAMSIGLAVSLPTTESGHAAEQHKPQCPKAYRVTGPYGQPKTLIVRKTYQELTAADRDWWLNDENTRYWWGYQRLLPPSNLVNCAGWVFHKLWNKGQYVIPAHEFYRDIVHPFGVEVSRSDARPGDIVVYLEPTEPVEARGKHIAVVVEHNFTSIMIETKDGPESLFRASLALNLPKWASLDPILKKYAQSRIYRVDPSKVRIEEVDAGECADDKPPAVAVNVAPPTTTPPADQPPPPQREPDPLPTDSPPIVITETPPPITPPTETPPGTEQPPQNTDQPPGESIANQGVRNPPPTVTAEAPPITIGPPVIVGPPMVNNPPPVRQPPRQPPVAANPPPTTQPPTPPPQQTPPPTTQPQATTPPPPPKVAAAPPAVPGTPGTPPPAIPYKTHMLSQPMTPGGQCPNNTAFELCKFGPLNASGAPSNGWVGCVFQRDENFVCTSLNAPPNCKCTQDRTGRIPPVEQLTAMAPAEPATPATASAPPAAPAAGTPASAAAPALAGAAAGAATGLMMMAPGATGTAHPNVVAPAAHTPPAAAAAAPPKATAKAKTKPKKEQRKARVRAPTDADIDSGAARAAAAATAIGIMGGVAIGGGFRGARGGHRSGGGRSGGRH